MSLQKVKDLFLLAFWTIAYLLKTIFEVPWLWIKSLFDEKEKR